MPDTDTNADTRTAVAALQRHVFVYGTLRRGQANDITRLAPAPCFVGAGSVAGRLYHFGSYPGVLLAPPQELPSAAEQPRVAGEVYAIEAALEVQLDAIEEVYPQRRDEYFKRELAVQIDGRSISCLVYEINPAYLPGAALIAGGDWTRRGTDDALLSGDG